MKENLYYLLFLLCISLTACQKEKPLDHIDIENIPEITLEMETLAPFKGYDIPELHLIEDTVILLADSKNSAYMRFFFLKDRTFKGYFLLRKEGLIRLQKDPEINTDLEMYSGASNILFNYKIKKNIFYISRMTRMHFTEMYTPEYAIRVDSNQIACIGPYKGLWGLFDEKYRRFNNFGNYPIKMDYIPSSFRPSLAGRISKHDNQLVYASNQFGYISSYKYKKKKLKKLWDKQLSDYQYENKGSRLVFNDNHKTGFRDVYMTSDYIYAIYDGFKNLEKDDFNPNRTNCIIVFDLEGNPVARYIFPFEINYMTMDSKRQYIYTTFAISKNNNYLVRFQVPSSPV